MNPGFSEFSARPEDQRDIFLGTAHHFRTPKQNCDKASWVTLDAGYSFYPLPLRQGHVGVPASANMNVGM
jgi:hypothetical protein